MNSKPSNLSIKSKRITNISSLSPNENIQNSNSTPICHQISSFSQCQMNQECDKKIVEIKKNRIQQSIKLFNCKDFEQTSFQAFNLLQFRLKKQKTLSLTLLDLNGNFIFTNKLGHQHFQGSLNNLDKKNFMSFMLACQKNHFIKQIDNIEKNGIQIDYFILSKNIKRKYAYMKLNQNSSNIDIFNRYLKGLTSRIKPIILDINNCRKIKGFWNINLIKRKNKKGKFLLLVSQFMTNLRNINNMNLQNDPIIKNLQSRLQQRIQFQQKVQKQQNINNDNKIDNQNQIKIQVKKYKIIKKLRNKIAKSKKRKTNQKKKMEKIRLNNKSSGLSVKKYLQGLPIVLNKKISEANLYQSQFFTDMDIRKQRLLQSFKMLTRNYISKKQSFLQNKILKKQKEAIQESQGLYVCYKN